MGLFAQDIKEIRQLEKQLENGQIGIEYYMARLAAKSQLEKISKQIIQIYALQAMRGGGILEEAKKINLLSEGEAIDLDADPETEKIKCPEKDDALITRAECLDYSGSHNGECNGCDHKVITQNLLLGPPESK